MAKLLSGTRVYGNLTVDANLTITGSILPSANVTYDLGSPTQRFRTGYFAANTVDLGGSTIGVDANGFNFTPAGSPTPIVMSANGAMTSNTFTASTVTIVSSTQSTHSAQGALVVIGGVGIGGALNVGGNLTVTGNLFINGNTTTINSNNLTVNDSMIYLAEENPADILDIGFTAHVVNPTLNHVGFVRDASDSTWKLFSNVAAQPSNTINFTGANYANLLVGNLSVIGINSTGNLSVIGINSTGFINTSANISAGGNVTVANLIVSTGAGRFNGPFNESTTVAGVYVGNLNLSPRVGFFNGTASQNWQIDNNFGSFRWYTPGVVRMSLDANGNLTVTGALIAGGGSGTAGQLLQSTGTGITWTAPTAGSQVSSGTSNVAVLSSGGNVVISIGGSIVANVGSSGLTVIGGISAGSITGNGAALTGLPAGYSNVNASTFLASGTLATAINTAGNVIAAAFIGNGAGLTGLPAGYSNVNAATFLASGTLTTAISTSGNITVGNIFPSANNVSNIGSASSKFRIVHAQATQAQYADLAEVYTSDQQYPAGTVVVFDGEAEVTQSRASHDTRIAGVVSTNPAYLMNSTETGVPVALQGRVPCRVLGPVSQGDRVVSSHIAGVAQALDPLQYQPGCIIGKALQAVESTDISIIEVVVGRV